MPDPTPPVAALAERVKADPFFLAAALATAARRHGWDDAALGRALDCDGATLAGLRLCRAPRPAHRTADVARIAAHFGIAPATLAGLLVEG